MRLNPYQVTKDFEQALCEYTGARYAVAVNSCTAALLLSVAWCRAKNIDYPYWDGGAPGRIYVEIPRHTYVSVPCSILHAGGRVSFRDEAWHGAYQLKPLPVWDCARRFTSGMYTPHQFQCVSFAASKILAAEQGGAILHDSPQADPWFRKMRFDGRTEDVDPGEDNFDVVGHHCIMTPSTAATLLLKLYHLPHHNPDLPDYPYPDLSLHPVFQNLVDPRHGGRLRG